MAKQNSTQNQSNITITLEAEFKHHTSIGPSGEVLYDAPMEIKNQADLDAYGITWDDCRTLNFHGSEKVTVYSGEREEQFNAGKAKILEEARRLAKFNDLTDIKFI